MQFAAIVTLFATAVMAVPATIVAREVCPGGPLNGNLQCCSTNVVNAAALDCKNPSSTPSNGADAGDICSKAGKQAMCCGVPVAGQGLVCVPVVGVA